ncbi:hypothetical protein ACS0TY_006590 [Phlomoides rotata]
MKGFGFFEKGFRDGINPNSKNHNLQTPLHLAAAEGLLYSEWVLLLETGASVLATNRWGKTPVDEARVGGDVSCCKMLRLLKCQKFLVT